MQPLTHVDEILDFAIRNEEEASAFYTDLAGRVEAPWMKETFLGFAQEELGHRQKLVAMKEGRLELRPGGRVQDLQIGDYLVDVVPAADMGYAEALVLAMKKEKAAFRLYSDLAAQVEGDARQLFLALAQEEAKHKLRFEVEYDEHVLREN